VEPIRVKLYGLFSMTKSRYIFQAAASAVGAVLVLVGWYFAWPGLRPRLTRPDLPASEIRTLIVAVMDAVPWILLAALAYQAAEVYVVLRAFARKEGQPR
jgi:hypothetical protein